MCYNYYCIFTGGKKKFLYMGPQSKESESNDKWQFIPRTGTPPFQSKFTISMFLLSLN